MLLSLMGDVPGLISGGDGAAPSATEDSAAAAAGDSAPICLDPPTLPLRKRAREVTESPPPPSATTRLPKEASCSRSVAVLPVAVLVPPPPSPPTFGLAAPSNNADSRVPLACLAALGGAEWRDGACGWGTRRKGGWPEGQ